MTTVTVSGFKIRKGERLYGTYVRYALYKATTLLSATIASQIYKATSLEHLLALPDQPSPCASKYVSILSSS